MAAARSGLHFARRLISRRRRSVLHVRELQNLQEEKQGQHKDTPAPNFGVSRFDSTPRLQGEKLKHGAREGREGGGKQGVGDMPVGTPIVVPSVSWVRDGDGPMS